MKNAMFLSLISAVVRVASNGNVQQRALAGRHCVVWLVHVARRAVVVWRRMMKVARRVMLWWWVLLRHAWPRMAAPGGTGSRGLRPWHAVGQVWWCARRSLQCRLLHHARAWPALLLLLLLLARSGSS
jgi:hypothetical protein